jgi:hypothetical protein
MHSDLPEAIEPVPFHFSHQIEGDGEGGMTVALQAVPMADLANATDVLRRGMPARVRLLLGISRVNQGDKQEYYRLKRELRKLESDLRFYEEEASLGVNNPSLAETQEKIRRAASDMERVKPDRYCRAKGREVAVANAGHCEGDLVSVLSTQKGTQYWIGAGGQCLRLWAPSRLGEGVTHAFLAAAAPISDLGKSLAF